LFAAILSAGAFALMPATASGAVPVTTTADEQDGECTVDCSLRDAVLIASRTADVVQVPAGSYTLSNGMLEVANVTIQGAGADATIIRAGVNARALLITSGATIGGVTITGGNPDDFNSGGGIEVGDGQLPITLRLNDSAVSGNAVVQSSQGFGGGIMVNGQATLLMTNTTVSGNRVLGGDGPGVGAGIYVVNGGRAELRNSTVSGNTAEEFGGGGSGGGIGLDDASTLVLESVTIASNTAATGGGIAEDLDFTSPIAPTIAISDTIVSGNAGVECSGALVHTGNHNLSDDATCAFTAAGDKPNADPQLGPLQINTGAGRTATHALPLGSAAMNAGNPAACKPTDQRGAPRPAGACDIGAFE
jgi:CSLREA domain-containing protein